MSVVPGMRLGPYSIVSKLGEGGMGEVYRGTDTRLGREVAIKVLPVASAASPDALARFEREGRAIAALNHPNICTLYDVGTDDGRPYLVMELLAGESLHQALAAGPLPVGELIDHAIALADALHAAHSRGIVHRDLKPANVFLTEHGTIKILDFGLAKDGLDRAHETPTIEAGLTGPGATLGTLSYMSPEQLRAEVVNARSDLFSLGLVLYETATARRAFTGKTFPEVSAAILHDEPPAPVSLRPELPGKLNEIILKLLEKDRDLRYQSAADLRGDLKRLKRGDAQTAAATGVASAAPSAAAAPPPSSSDAALAAGLARRHPLALAGLAAVLVAAAAAAWWGLGSSGSDRTIVSELSLQPLTFHGQAGGATISPDGRFIAYVRRSGNDSSVVVKQLRSDSEVVILPPRSGFQYFAPAVTPDGGYVDVLEAEVQNLPIKTRIIRVPFLGGAPRQLVGDGARSGIGWSPDGRRMAFNRSDQPGQNSIAVADHDGQNARVLVTRRAPSFFVNVTFGQRAARPSWSPDGRQIAVIGIDTSPGKGGSTNEIVEIDADSGMERVVSRGGPMIELAYLDQSRWIASTLKDGSAEWQIVSREGAAVAVTRDLSYLVGVQLTAARDTGVAIRTALRSAIEVGGVAAGDFAQVIEESGAESADAALDSAGNIFYFAKVSEGPATFRRAAQGGASTLIATNLIYPQPSPDGSFVIGHRPNVGLVRVNADGSDARVLLQDASAFPYAITHDNSTLIYQSNREGHQQPWRLALGSGAAERLSDVSILSRRLWLSPDERQVIFGTSAGTTLCAFPSFDGCRTIQGGPGPFSPDGKTVFSVRPSEPANILAQPIDGRAPTPLTRYTDRRIVDFSVSPDGRRMAITRGEQLSDVVLIRGLK